MSNAYTKTSPKSFRGERVVFVDGAFISASQTNLSWTDQLDGWRNPTWKTTVRRGGDATTPMVASRRRVFDVSNGVAGTTHYTSAAHTTTETLHVSGVWPGVLTFPGIPTGLSIEAAYSAAAGAFWRDVTSQMRALQGGALIGEIAQTFRMVKSRSISMMGLLTRWNSRLQRSKRYRRTRAHRAKEASDAYLEFQFGWNPLARDIYSGLNAFVSPRREASRARGSAQRMLETTCSVGADGAVPNSSYLLQQVVTVNKGFASVQFRGGVSATASMTGEITEKFGLLPSDFVPTLYELMPWSFLIDYVTNLGTMIDSLCAPRGSVTWCNYTAKKIRTRRVQVNFRLANTPLAEDRVRSQVTTPFQGCTEVATVERVKVSPDLVRVTNFEFKIPGFTTQWMNLSALFAARKFKYWP